jgi:hypothetical protein
MAAVQHAEACMVGSACFVGRRSFRGHCRRPRLIESGLIASRARARRRARGRFGCGPRREPRTLRRAVPLISVHEDQEGRRVPPIHSNLIATPGAASRRSLPTTGTKYVPDLENILSAKAMTTTEQLATEFSDKLRVQIVTAMWTGEL